MNAPLPLPGSAGAPAWLLTPQRVDPLGVLGVRPLTLLGGLAAFAYAVIATIVQWSQVTSPVVAVVALITVAAAIGWFLRCAHPDHAPFGPLAQATVLFLALAASLLESLSRMGANRLVQDDYGQIVVGILLLSMAPYRSGLSLVIGAIVASMVLGVDTLVDVPSLAIQVPYPEYVIVVVVPPLALGFAAASFSSGLVASVHQWQRDAARAALDTSGVALAGVARSVQQEQVSVLSREALPFLMHVLAAGEIAEADPDRARAIAQHLRGSLVAEIGRTWLDEVVEPIVLVGGAAAEVIDPDLLALSMSGEQRAATAALAEAVGAAAVLQPRALRIELQPEKADRARVTVTATVADGIRMRQARAALVQYLAVVRVVFEHVSVDLHLNTLTVGFDYAQQ